MSGMILACMAISALCLVGVIESHAQEDLPELEDHEFFEHGPDGVMICEIVVNDVHRMNKDGLKVIPTEMTFCRSIPPPPPASLDDCTKTEGTIRWDARFGDQKILPDLQDMIDFGARELCVQIVHDDETHVTKLLSENGIQIGEETTQHTIPTKISPDMLDTLTGDPHIVSIDLYGKTLKVPWYGQEEHGSKITSYLQRVIDSGRIDCRVIAEFESYEDCPLLPKNKDGKEMFPISIRLLPLPLWPDGSNGWSDPWTEPTREQKYAYSLKKEANNMK